MNEYNLKIYLIFNESIIVHYSNTNNSRTNLSLWYIMNFHHNTHENFFFFNNLSSPPPPAKFIRNYNNNR